MPYRMRKHLLLLALSFCSSWSFACMDLAWSIDKVMSDSTVSFVASGYILSIQNMRSAEENNVPVEYIFEINKFWKGEFSNSKVELYENLPCISHFNEGEEYIIFGFVKSDSLFIWGKSNEHDQFQHLTNSYAELDMHPDYTIYYFAGAVVVLVIGIMILRHKS